MQSVMQLRDRRQQDLAQHPLFTWLKNDNVAIEEKLHFLPALASFSMGFRDVNKWVLRYPVNSDDYRRAINDHTFEDQTHSVLYLEDWKKLGLDDVLEWTASDTLWWLFLAEANETARKHGIYFLSMATADVDDPFLRFAHSEVIEACGNVFFENVVHVANALTEKTGEDYRYLGPFHLARETGHMDTEGVFEETVLTPAQRERALQLANTMFDIFEEMFTQFLEYAQRYVAHQPPRPEETPALQTHMGPADRKSLSTVKKEAVTTACHVTQRTVRDLLNWRKFQTANHPFYEWLQHHRDLSAKQALQRFLPMWAMDIMGYRDLNHYAMRYPNPATPLERDVNRWVDDLTTHNTLYLADWRALDLDKILGWSASETLRFCFLDPHVEAHRRNIAKFVSLASKYPKPVQRIWLMHVLEASGDAFFATTRTLALQAEAEEPQLRLDYLADRHQVAHTPQHVATTHPAATISTLSLTEYDQHVVTTMINTVFDAVDEQLDISLDIALSNRFDIP